MHDKHPYEKQNRRGNPNRKPANVWQRPEPKLETTTLWDYPSQHYGAGRQGHAAYKGATPSYVIWNLLKRYTREGDTVIDPMCGSGTTLDVCRDLARSGKGFDLAPFREDIQQADARKIPVPDLSADFVFMDPPYSTHLKYSGRPECIGELDEQGSEYYAAMDQVFAETFRILKDRRYLGVYVSDSFKKGKPFGAIGFRLFGMLEKRFKPIDIICVTRHNRTLQHGQWHKAAAEGGFFLRGFNYLLIFKKELPQHRSGF